MLVKFIEAGTQLYYYIFKTIRKCLKYAQYRYAILMGVLFVISQYLGVSVDTVQVISMKGLVADEGLLHVTTHNVVIDGIPQNTRYDRTDFTSHSVHCSIVSP